jgi:hypothetical protein
VFDTESNMFILFLFLALPFNEALFNIMFIDTLS